MAERACDSDTGELPQIIDLAPDSNNRIQPQELDGHGGVAQVNLTRAERIDDRWWQRLDVNLQAYRQRGCRWHCRDDFLHSQHIGPQLLVAESVVTKDSLSVLCAREPGTVRGHWSHLRQDSLLQRTRCR
jgi:hypothetical protein